jgi:hypothetical protein
MAAQGGAGQVARLLAGRILAQAGQPRLRRQLQLQLRAAPWQAPLPAPAPGTVCSRTSCCQGSPSGFRAAGGMGWPPPTPDVPRVRRQPGGQAAIAGAHDAVVCAVLGAWKPLFSQAGTWTLELAKRQLLCSGAVSVGPCGVLWRYGRQAFPMEPKACCTACQLASYPGGGARTTAPSLAAGGERILAYVHTRALITVTGWSHIGLLTCDPRGPF